MTLKSLPNRMHRNPDIKQELQGLSPRLAEFPVTVPYQVPEGYFDSLAGAVIGRIRNEVWAVPEGYFDQLPELILDRIRESESLSSPKAPAPVVRLASWKKWAVAAAIGGAGLLGAWYLWNQEATNLGIPTQNLAAAEESLSDDELDLYLEQETLPGGTALFSPLEEDPQVLTVADMNENTLQDILASVSDTELEAYINNHPELKSDL